MKELRRINLRRFQKIRNLKQKLKAISWRFPAKLSSRLVERPLQHPQLCTSGQEAELPRRPRAVQNHVIENLIGTGAQQTKKQQVMKRMPRLATLKVKTDAPTSKKEMPSLMRRKAMMSMVMITTIDITSPSSSSST